MQVVIQPRYEAERRAGDVMIIELTPNSIAEFKARIVEGKSRGVHWGSLASVEAHMIHMRQDFVGLPEICWVHGQLIALIRRRLNLPQNVSTFLSLWFEEADFLVEHLNSRWLLAAADTIACHGPPVQRATAAALSSMIHMLQVCETERLVLRDSRYDSGRYTALTATHREKKHVLLWDGVKAEALEFGDSARNMLTYMTCVVDRDAVMGPIGRALITRAIGSDTVLGRLAKLNAFMIPPVLAEPATTETNPVLVGSIEGSNIVQLGHDYFVVPQSLGALDLELQSDRERPGIVKVDSILDAVRVATMDRA